MHSGREVASSSREPALHPAFPPCLVPSPPLPNSLPPTIISSTSILPSFPMSLQCGFLPSSTRLVASFRLAAALLIAWLFLSLRSLILQRYRRLVSCLPPSLMERSFKSTSSVILLGYILLEHTTEDIKHSITISTSTSACLTLPFDVMYYGILCQ